MTRNGKKEELRKEKAKYGLFDVDILMQNLPEARETDPGAFVVVNDNDNVGGDGEYSGNGTPDKNESDFDRDDPDLQPLVLQLEAMPEEGNVTLDVPEGVKLWKDRRKSEECTRRQWDLTDTDDYRSLQQLSAAKITDPSLYVEAVGKGEIGTIGLRWATHSGQKQEDHMRVTGIRVKISDVVDKDGQSVHGKTFDLKTGITENKPARIKYEIEGTDHEFTVKEDTLSARYDTEDEAHVAFYGAPTEKHKALYGLPVKNRVVFRESESSPSADKSGGYSFRWDGRGNRKCDSKKGGKRQGLHHRLLLGGEYRLRMGLKLEQLGDVICHSKFSSQKVAEPHAGHYCADWPRASVYDMSEIDPECIKSDEPDSDTGDMIRPMLKDAHDDTDDGGWWRINLRFQYQGKNQKQEAFDKWLVYTTSFKTEPEEFDGECKLEVVDDSICRTDENDYADPEQYPAGRVAILARYDDVEDKWRMYHIKYPFRGGISQETSYYEKPDQKDPLYLASGDSCALSYDGKFVLDEGDDENNYIIRPDFKVELTAPQDPPDGAEVAFFLLPSVHGLAGTYNDQKTKREFVKVDMGAGQNDLTGNEDILLKCYRGYAGRNFWDRWICEDGDGNDVYAGVKYSSGVTGNNAFLGHAHRNMEASQAKTNWEQRDGIVEVSAHSNAGLFGWYTADKAGELFNPENHGAVRSTEFESMDLDDVFLFIAGGCHTAEKPDDDPSLPGAMSLSGVDVTMSWDGPQYKGRYLFVKHFFEQALTPVEVDGHKCGRTLRDAMKNTRDPMLKEDNFPEDRYDYIIRNLNWHGLHGGNLDMTLWPPRYGQDDSELTED